MADTADSPVRAGSGRDLGDRALSGRALSDRSLSDRSLSGRSPSDRSPSDRSPSGRGAPAIETRRRRGWLALYAVTSFLSFPHPLLPASLFGEGAVLDLGIALGWVAPACLVLALRGRSPRGAAVTAAAGTLAGHALILHWFYVVTVTFGHAPAAVGVIAPIGGALYPAFLAALLGAGWAWLRDRGAGPFAFALAWTALDYLRGFFLGGFPWATLGYSQHLNPGMMGLAPFAGVYGLSFAVALGGAALAFGYDARTSGRSLPRAVRWAAVAVVALHLIGIGLRPSADASEGMERSLRVAAIQGNIEQGVKWDPAWLERTLGHYLRLSRQAAAAGAQLIVWPETAVPGALEADSVMKARIEALADETGAALVVGGVGVELDRRSGRIRRFFDSAFLLRPGHGITDRYDKTHLVPFGEYVPFRDLLGDLLGSVAAGIASSDVTPGEAPRAVAIWPGASGESRDPGAESALAGGAEAVAEAVKVGTPICYELLFPDLVRRFVDDGAGILLGITNDAWYGRTGAPYQFLAITKMRSAETGVFTLRVANTGVSAVIDSGGRVRERTLIFERGLLVADVPLRRASSRTFYVRYGDVFARLCCGALALLTAHCWWLGRSGETHVKS